MNMMSKIVKGSFLVLVFVFIMSCFNQTNALIDDFVHVKYTLYYAIREDIINAKLRFAFGAKGILN